MKKILFLSLLIIALGYPALTIWAQEAAQDILEEMLVVESPENDNLISAEEMVAQSDTLEPLNVSVTQEEIDTVAEVVEAPKEDEVIAEVVEMNTTTEEALEEVSASDDADIEVITPRNPETEVIVSEPQTEEEVVEITETPMDKAVTKTESVSTTHPQLNLTPDKSEMIRLSEKAASVVVGNPNHISVLLDTPDTIIVVPRMQGASHFTVIGENGKVIMQRHVVVGGSSDNYVRIRRSCGADDRSCQQTSVYYCPNTCHEVMENTQATRRR
ncbi:MAG: pilus assembly protein N-terminal domain-containing protein [Pseudomonadota bacterium]